MTMTDTQHVTRRATVEDLPQLLALWRLERLPAELLEKRFTEFQLVSDADGTVLAAIGIQIAGTQAWLHSEAIARPEINDALREQLWNRLQVLIRNHALERLWTSLNAVYWRDLGFARATPEQLKTVPAAFSAGGGEWHVMSLRAADANAVLEREFADIKALQQREIERAQERVRWFKRVALGITVVVFLIVIVFVVVLLKFGPQIFRGR